MQRLSTDGIARCRGRKRCYQRTNTPSSTERRKDTARAYTVSTKLEMKLSEECADTGVLNRTAQVDKGQSTRQSARFLISRSIMRRWLELKAHGDSSSFVLPS